MSKGDTRREAGYKPTAAESATLAALEAPKRRPTAAGAPPLTTFPGPKPKLLPGQSDVFGGVRE